MAIVLSEDHAEFGPAAGNDGLLGHCRRSIDHVLHPDTHPVRFAIASTSASGYHCEFGVLRGLLNSPWPTVPSIFGFRKRVVEHARHFNIVLLVPTGIGAEIGGHAGDAGPLASLLAAVADTVIVHPNVVNASDINEMPHNALYVEGSVITRLLMGTVGLQPVRANRVLVVLDAHHDEYFVNAAVNTVNAARSTYGLSCAEIVCLKDGVRMSAQTAPSGRAAGRVEQLDSLLNLLLDRMGPV